MVVPIPEAARWRVSFHKLVISVHAGPPAGVSIRGA